MQLSKQYPSIIKFALLYQLLQASEQLQVDEWWVCLARTAMCFLEKEDGHVLSLI